VVRDNGVKLVLAIKLWPTEYSGEDIEESCVQIEISSMLAV